MASSSLSEESKVGKGREGVFWQCEKKESRVQKEFSLRGCPVKSLLWLRKIKLIRARGLHVIRLQNSPYFCVLKYARAVKQNVWNDAENIEPDWGETPKIRTVGFFLSSRHIRPRGVWGSRASRAWDSYRFIYWFWEKKTDCFAVYASHEYWSHILSMWPTFYIAGIFSKALLLASLGSDDF